MVVGTTKTCRNMDRLCENFGIIKGALCILLEIFRQITYLAIFLPPPNLWYFEKNVKFSIHGLEV